MVIFLCLAFFSQVPPKPVAQRPPVLSVVADLAGNRVYAGLADRLVLIDPAKGDVLQQLPFQGGPVTALALDTSGRNLVAATGKAGESGVLHLYAVSPQDGTIRETGTLTGPKDLIMNMVFSGDGRKLAAVGYDRLVRVWELENGKAKGEPVVLKDHSDWVRGVAFSPDNQKLATSGGDRSVKLWDLKTGKLLDSFNDATDSVHAVLWSPDGSFVLSAGGDRTLRKRPVSGTDVSPVESLFGHSKGIVALTRSPSDDIFLTLGDDRIIKWFRHTPLRLERTSESLPGPVTGLFYLGKTRIVVGSRDGNIYVLDAQAGKVTATIAADKEPAKPEMSGVEPNFAIRGQRASLRIRGKNLGAIRLADPLPSGMRCELSEISSEGYRNFVCEVSKGALPGVKTIPFVGPNNWTGKLEVEVALSVPIQTVTERESQISSPSTFSGKLDKAGEVDRYRLKVPPGHAWGVLGLPGSGTKWTPEMELTDPQGTIIAVGSGQLLVPLSDREGDYWVSVRDREFNGGAGREYRLHVGDIPILDSAFPMAVAQGEMVKVTLRGIHLPGQTVDVVVPQGLAPGSQFDLPPPWNSIPGAPKIMVSKIPVSRHRQTLKSFPVLVQSEVIGKNGEDIWEFEAKKGAPLWIETLGQRVGSPVDTSIRLTNLEGKDLTRCRLIPSSQVVVVFRDHDSSGSGIRLESWKNLAVNDYLYAGGELMRIRTLPRNPDDDCQFHSREGKRMGWEGTTPVQHPIGQTLLKVSVQPPGTTSELSPLPPVDLPLVSDDGWGAMGRDSGLLFKPPSDGIYQVRVRDSRGPGHGGPYLLSIAPHEPDFSLRAPGGQVQHPSGGAGELNIEVDRVQEHTGRLDIKVEGLPKGWMAGNAFIAEGENSTTLLLQASPGAPELTTGWTIRVTDPKTGKTRTAPGIGGKTIPEARVLATPAKLSMEMKSGQVGRLPVTLERKGDFKGRVPLEVRGLPPGVRVLDVGLNGILIPPDQTERVLQFEVDPWFTPGTVHFYLVAREEGKGQTNSQMVKLQVIP